MHPFYLNVISLCTGTYFPALTSIHFNNAFLIEFNLYECLKANALQYRFVGSADPQICVGTGSTWEAEVSFQFVIYISAVALIAIAESN